MNLLDRVSNEFVQFLCLANLVIYLHHVHVGIVSSMHHIQSSDFGMTPKNEDIKNNQICFQILISNSEVVKMK